MFQHGTSEIARWLGDSSRSGGGVYVLAHFRGTWAVYPCRQSTHNLAARRRAAACSTAGDTRNTAC